MNALSGMNKTIFNRVSKVFRYWIGFLCPALGIEIIHNGRICLWRLKPMSALVTCIFPLLKEFVFFSFHLSSVLCVLIISVLTMCYVTLFNSSVFNHSLVFLLQVSKTLSPKGNGELKLLIMAYRMISSPSCTTRLRLSPKMANPPSVT